MTNKPTVFNYQDYEKVVRQNEMLKEELTRLRKMIPGQTVDGDLISRQDAIDALSEDVMGGLNYKRILQSLPSADAVEVVRCMNCKHSRIEGDTTLFMWCGYWNKPTDGNRYCSDGERREA